MPRTDTLEERAARAQQELDAVQEQQRRIAQQSADALARHQSAVDEQAIDAYDRAALDADVTDARQALDRAIEEAPLTQALTAYFIAVAKRREVFDQYIGARGRQGHDISSPQYPPPPGIDNLADLISTKAQELTSQWRQEFAEDFHERRNNPPTTTRKKE